MPDGFMFNIIGKSRSTNKEAPWLPDKYNFESYLYCLFPQSFQGVRYSSGRPTSFGTGNPHLWNCRRADWSATRVWLRASSLSAPKTRFEPRPCYGAGEWRLYRRTAYRADYICIFDTSTFTPESEKAAQKVFEWNKIADKLLRRL